MWGYSHSDMVNALITLAVIVALGSIAIWEGIKWAWPYVKAVIHAATA